MFNFILFELYKKLDLNILNLYSICSSPPRSLYARLDCVQEEMLSLHGWSC